MQKTVVIIGPAYPLRGGIAASGQRLAQEFVKEGVACEMISFSLQYPSILFPGKTQYSTDGAPKGLNIRPLINSVNPVNWLKMGNLLRDQRPDIVVVRYWIPFMGPALGTILRRIKGNGHTRIICLADNISPHEHRPGDKVFTRYFLKACDGFITMSDKVMRDLRFFEKEKPAILVPHPLYDTFGERVDKQAAREKLGLNKEDKIALFFGIIRHYKGLDLLLRAMSDTRIKHEGIKLLIAGEFYEDEKLFRQLIEQYNLANLVIIRNEFVPDPEVKYYLCAADVVVQPYRNATQSGVTPLAYHFEKPMIVTNVGGLPSMVPHERAGLICEPEPSSIADALLRFYQLGEQYFIPHLRTEKQKYAWSNLTGAVYKLAEEIKK
jgi:glycosyltransferase involved in cell wall biosynthesis